MAATDKYFNNQRTLDIVFGVSNVLMLASVIWMFVQDYQREYKTEQRVFRDVEVDVAIQQALMQMPSKEEFEAAEAAAKAALDAREAGRKTTEYLAAQAAKARLTPPKDRAEASFQAVKAEFDSKMSLRNIALEHGDKDLGDYYDNLLNTLGDQLAKVQGERDALVMQLKAEQLKIDAVEGDYTKKAAAFKKVNDKFDTQVKLALSKRWAISDSIRAAWFIDAFQPSLKIHQFTIKDIPIDYNFAQVTRFDRCMSCHVGIDRPAYTRANLEALTPDAYTAKLEDARKLYDDRIKALDDKDKAQVPNPHLIQATPLTRLTPGRITEFAAHPRLDLFVGANSKHPAEKFGCTSCHSGQGSGTSFNDSSHSPNSAKAREAWSKERHWEFNHMWDFPMHPTRFAESSCLKCHHEVTDLISSDNRVEAPKLLRGYNLIKENGCFGCHEISGWKSGNRVGPDLRLEPNPPLEDLLPIERFRAENDPDNRPGNLRKVGPSLARVSEKVSEEWMAKWVKSPSSFRPDTKMPHYYGLSTNDVSVLVETAPDHEKKAVKQFPNTEIASIAYFITRTSKTYLQDAAKHQKDSAEARAKDEARLVELLNMGRLPKSEQDEMAAIKRRISLRKVVPLVDLAPKHKGNAEKGRLLFTERGCLSCHAHQGTETKQNSKSPELVAPSIHSDAVFGPNLSQLAAKIGKSDTARAWLIQWIVDPHVHSPRSRMPITHLTPDEASDIATWLMAQPAADAVGPGWETNEVKPPSMDELKSLTRVHLIRMLSNSDTDKFLAGTLTDTELEIIGSDLPNDEKDLAKKVGDENALKFYLGKKAVMRLGCYACHDIPGFEAAKPIGVALNDWGKKAPDRLAFEDIKNFFKAHYREVDGLVDANGKPHGELDGKKPYEKYYAEELIGHHPSRIGYLNQKIRDPRSYDYNRIRAWDDRARMPTFTLGRPRKKEDEKDADFKARAYMEEAQAREAVATFVLGLTAEYVPDKSINHPSGDRLAEVKGRQILDKYNCNGCHVIRPGMYEFKPSDDTLKHLIDKQAFEAKEMKIGGEIIHANHINWVGRNPIDTERLTAYSTRVDFFPDDNAIVLRLTEALRFKDKENVKNIPAGGQIMIPLADLGVDPKSIKTQEDFERRFGPTQPYGGAFTDLMVNWLNKKDPKRYPLAGDAADARSGLPPSLVGQGERTQSDWLYRFLLDPQRVRRMTILRMPKFNMSKEEAKTLVDYFAGVTHQTNPGIALPFPHEVIAPREEFTGDYWKRKTAEYIAQLKAAKGEKGKSAFDERLAYYTPLWEDLRKDQEPAMQANIQKLQELIKTKTKERDDTDKKFQAATDPAKRMILEKELESLKITVAGATEELADAQKSLARLDVKTQRALWESEEAYAADAFRLLMSRDLCTKCHQVGNVKAGEQLKQGPPLDLAVNRLRPGFLERWVDKPTRFVPYASMMPPYFNQFERKHQGLLAGGAAEQILAIRDVLLNYPRVSALPINRLHSPDRK